MYSAPYGAAGGTTLLPSKMQREPEVHDTPLMSGCPSGVPRPPSASGSCSSECVPQPSPVVMMNPRRAPATHTPSSGQATASSSVASPFASGLAMTAVSQCSSAGSVDHATWPWPSSAPGPTAVQKRIDEHEIALNALSAAASVCVQTQFA